jgi:hypothetical protein
MVRGDEYYVAVCNKTGAISIYNESKNLFLSPYADGPIEFFTNPDGTQNIKNLSRFGRSFSILRVPYSLKLLIQELQVMNVQMRIITDENVDQLLNMSYSNNVNKLLKTNDSIDLIFKNVSATMNSELKKNRAIENQYQIPPIEEFGENPEFGNITASPEEMQQMSPDYAPGTPAYNPESPAYAPGTPPQFGSQESSQFGSQESPAYAPGTPSQFGQPESPAYAPGTPETFAYEPIIQEFGKTPSTENTLSETEQTILEVEEPKTEQEKTETATETEVKKIETTESTESNSSETRKITL